MCLARPGGDITTFDGFTVENTYHLLGCYAGVEVGDCMTSNLVDIAFFVDNKGQMEIGWIALLIFY